MRVAPEIILTSEQQDALVRLARSKRTPARVAQRAHIVLLAARGMQNKDIATELNVGRVQVARWRERYLHSGLAAIEGDMLRGLERPKSDAHPLAIEAPAPSGREPSGVSHPPRPRRPASHLPAETVPDVATRQLMRRFEFARNARLIERLEDIVGVYVSPCTRALVLCCDETDLDTEPGRTRPGTSPAGPAQAVRTDDQVRTGAGLLFAALSKLDQATDEMQPHVPGHAELLTFLRQIERETANGKTLHVIADSDAAAMPPATEKWLAAHRHVHLHFAPASVPWINGVAWFFSHIDDALLRRSAFASVRNLINAVEDHMAGVHAPGAAFRWTRRMPGRHRVDGSPREGGARSRRRSESDYVALPRTSLANGSKAITTGSADNLRDYVTTLKRERILQEASRLFFEHGYQQTSVDAIAESLGATKPFVYYHFNSKADILVEICERSNRAAVSAATNAMSTRGSPRVRFEQFLREFTDVVLRDHQMVAIYFREQISLPAEAAARIDEMRKAIDVRLTSLLVEGVESGDFQIEDTRIGALVIAGMSSFAFAWYRENGRLEQQEVTDRIVRMALKLVSASGYMSAPAYSQPMRATSAVVRAAADAAK